jgi:hypothetical protein
MFDFECLVLNVFNPKSKIQNPKSKIQNLKKIMPITGTLFSSYEIELESHSEYEYLIEMPAGRKAHKVELADGTNLPFADPFAPLITLPASTTAQTIKVCTVPVPPSAQIPITIQTGSGVLCADKNVGVSLVPSGSTFRVKFLPYLGYELYTISVNGIQEDLTNRQEHSLEIENVSAPIKIVATAKNLL